MNRLLSFLKNKYFNLILATVVLIVVIRISMNKADSFTGIRNVISVPLSPIQEFLTNAGQRVEDFFTLFKEIKNLKEENEILKIKINELEKENRELKSYKDKIEELKQALNLKDKFEDYEVIGANVIAKEPGNWFYVFKIALGSRHGVEVDYPVVSSTNGLVGRIISVDNNSSKVMSIIDENSTVSGWVVKSGGGHVIVRGDLLLKEEGLCSINYITINVDVAVGDVIETSGLGGVYPKGIIIGRVKEIRESNNELERNAIIQPEVDFKGLQEVFVLKRKNDS